MFVNPPKFKTVNGEFKLFSSRSTGDPFKVEAYTNWKRKVEIRGQERKEAGTSTQKLNEWVHPICWLGFLVIGNNGGPVGTPPDTLLDLSTEELMKRVGDYEKRY